MYYYQTEKVTIVAIQKNNLLHNVRQMYITVQVEKDSRIFSFYWTLSPMVIIRSKLYGNKASADFEDVWNTDNLINSKALLHHTADDTYSYISLIHDK